MRATYRFLLVGRTGNGKSSTGNTILGGKEFTVHGVNDSTDNDVMEKRFGNINKQLVQIIDGTGIGDNGETRINDVVLFKSIEHQAFSDDKQAKSLTAILLVLKFGVRFTKQERTSVEHVKLLLGDDVFKKFGVIVMTYGDNFVKDQTGGFKAWCRNQAGDFKNIFEECKGRCVLFNNKCQMQSETRDQVGELFQIVKNSGIPSYTYEDFKVSQIENFPKAVNRHVKSFKDRMEQIKRLHKKERKNEAINLLTDVLKFKFDLKQSNLMKTKLLEDIDLLSKKIEIMTHRHKKRIKAKRILNNGYKDRIPELSAQIEKCHENERCEKKEKIASL